jgi:hypothetical protein
MEMPMPNDFNTNTYDNTNDNTKDNDKDAVHADLFARAVECVKKMEPARRSPEAVSRALGLKTAGQVSAMWPRLIARGLVEPRDGGRASKSAPGTNPPATARDGLKATKPVTDAVTPVVRSTTAVPAEPQATPEVTAAAAGAPVTRTRVRVGLSGHPDRLGRRTAQRHRCPRPDGNM